LAVASGGIRVDEKRGRGVVFLYDLDMSRRRIFCGVFKMKAGGKKWIRSLFLSVLVFFWGCGGASEQGGGIGDEEGLGTTVGMVAEVFSSGVIPVRGYALVGGLNGTGSSQCPVPIRSYLEKYILRQVAGSKVDVDGLISSEDTAVVAVEGVLPGAAQKNQVFDVVVSALAGAETTSLDGGWLYGADLYEAGRFGVAIKALATAEGPVYIDKVGRGQLEKRRGYVLGGGTVLDDYKINLGIRRPDYETASVVRNRLNERFGYGMAWAVSPGRIDLQVPGKYRDMKARFLLLVRAMYLTVTQERTKERVMHFVSRLAGAEDKQDSELALEAIGGASLGKLGALLNSSNEEVRLRAARVMVNLGDKSAMEALWQIARDKSSSYRVEALDAICRGGEREEAATTARGLVRDEDFGVRLAAYEHLRRLDDVSISRVVIGESFFLESIAQLGSAVIYCYRSGAPRVVLLGAPIRCNDDIFIQTPDGSVTINAPAGQEHVSLMRTHPKHHDVIARVQSSYDLSDIIAGLCSEPVQESAVGRTGLGVSYSDLLYILKAMSEQSAVDAEFQTGGLAESAVPEGTPYGGAVNVKR